MAVARLFEGKQERSQFLGTLGLLEELAHGERTVFPGMLTPEVDGDPAGGTYRISGPDRSRLRN